MLHVGRATIPKQPHNAFLPSRTLQGIRESLIIHDREAEKAFHLAVAAAAVEGVEGEYACLCAGRGRERWREEEAKGWEGHSNFEGREGCRSPGSNITSTSSPAAVPAALGRK